LNKYIFTIIFLVSFLIAVSVWIEPTKAFFSDKNKVENELRIKNAEKDSLANLLENIKNNSNDLEKSTRNSGYAKKGETMLKIVSNNPEEESKKLKVSMFLLFALTVVVALIILFAIPKKGA
jgi:uncharacterized membrane protein